MHPSEKTLRRALTANAVFSSICAAECLLASGPVSRFTGISQGEILSLGVNLAVFAALIAFLLTRDLRQTWTRAAVGVIIALDVLWVIGSAAVLLTASPLTVAGKWTVAIVALAVGDFAFFQWRGWRGLGRRTEMGESAAKAAA